MSVSKKIIILFFCFFAYFIFMPTETTMAKEYYSTGTSNVVLVEKRGTGESYLNIDTIEAYIYNPPKYRLAANIFVYDTKARKIVFSNTIGFDYDIDQHTIYSVDLSTGVRKGPLNPEGSSADRTDFRIAQIMWNKAYNMNWK